MSTPIERATGTSQFMLYDGTNSADILAFAVSTGYPVTLKSEADGVLKMFSEVDGDLPAVHVGDRVTTGGYSVTAANWASSYIVKG